MGGGTGEEKENVRGGAGERLEENIQRYVPKYLSQVSQDDFCMETCPAYPNRMIWNKPYRLTECLKSVSLHCIEEVKSSNLILG